ncbi:MAG TPA: glycerophosphodiester phosphodiesterase family protein [Bryobacteraceae bacterium]|nr:glycerophosphodiester phosphodiesterase family protein [Bryobacteraceae bacterium]
MPPTRSALCFLVFVLTFPPANAALYERGHQLLVCHRTANRDAPENTLEAIRVAKILGCDVVEMDISRTLDGVLVLLHDGPIDRISSGSGEIEKKLSDEMTLYDAGDWFNARFHGIRQPRFLDALRLAKDEALKLELDLKSRGITRDVYDMVRAEGMLDRVSFGGHAEELPQVAPDWHRQRTVSWKPEMGSAEVAQLHGQDKFVIASFSFNEHEMDFALMQKAVATGVDALSVDRPRLAAEALGRPIEARALQLASEARSGELPARLRAVSKLSEFRDLPLTAVFASLVLDPEPAVSRAAVVALALRHESGVLPALLATYQKGGKPVHSGANLAWLAGMTGATAEPVHRFLLRSAASSDPLIAEESLRALARLEVSVPIELLRQRLDDPHPLVRGAAALALAKHDPDSAPALRAAAVRLRQEIYACWSSYAQPAKPEPLGKARTTFERPAPTRPGATAQIAQATELYRAYQNVSRAFASMQTPEARQWLEEETLRVAPDFSGGVPYVTATQLWDRADPQSLAPGLEMQDPMRRDRAQWTLLKRGLLSAPDLRRLLASHDTDARLRAAETLAWLGDESSKPALRNLIQSDPDQKRLYEWCLHKLDEVDRIRQGAF